MASFNQHLSGGTIVGSVGASTGFLFMDFSISQTATAFILGCLGAILPDIDSDTSKPIQFLFGYLGILLPIGFLSALGSSHFSMENLLPLMVGGYFMVRYLISNLFLRFTTHRGIIHSIPAAILCGQITYLFFINSTPEVRLAFALVTTVGYLTHLAMDEMWSIDLSGLKIKRSFGSALCFKSASKLGTFGIYLLIVVMGFLLVIMAPDNEVIKSRQTTQFEQT